MSVKIEVAETTKQFDAGSRLIRAYADFLGLDLEFQGFSSELASLPKMYGPPKGALLLATLEGIHVGAVGLREFEPGVAEMKRMYVLPDYHGMGVGKALTEAFLGQAREMGYGSARLDSIRELDKALRLYQDFGFREIEPYRFNPHPEAVFMEYKIS
ncbi:GNAT family N-acetyltransferase [Marinobacter sp. 1-4A]|uniref:GNAT family N-acetyltransferase n=1 Tax=Marinobacter TaxID=2742 RepID=UPI0019073FCE|nr:MULTISPECIES: GNAT family N-acetyltransferase [Marinobacter]MBK1853215.1 GNAT family N-acetyltransferase [Marinobacter sp. 1-4A]MCD1630799.1 GNAT family N-acetyltransferase [Marinobacter shengliensis]